jgi:hypothetical protein
MISSDAFKNTDHLKNRIDVLDKIMYIAEETIFYKCNELDDNLFFIKKFSIRLLKNQKNILIMSID